MRLLYSPQRCQVEFITHDSRSANTHCPQARTLARTESRMFGETWPSSGVACGKIRTMRTRLLLVRSDRAAIQTAPERDARIGIVRAMLNFHILSWLRLLFELGEKLRGIRVALPMLIKITGCTVSV